MLILRASIRRCCVLTCLRDAAAHPEPRIGFHGALVLLGLGFPGSIFLSATTTDYVCRLQPPESGPSSAPPIEPGRSQDNLLFRSSATTTMASSRSLSRALVRPARQLLASQTRALSATPRLFNEPPHKELQVGELEGAKFKIEPLRRVGEDDKTKRARLLCPWPIFPSSVDPPSSFSFEREDSC